MEGKLVITSSPHIRSSETVRSIMLSVIVALIPATVYSVVIFGFRALIIISISVISSILAEALFNLMIRKKQTIGDLSAALSGLLLAFTLPPTVPLWIPVFGAFFAIIIVKGLFGGLGSNFLNPALAARAFLFVSWPAHMTVWLKPFEYGKLPLLMNINYSTIVTSATPLNQLKDLEFSFSKLIDLFWGNVGGCIGETSAVLLILGGLYLMIRKVISWRIPFYFIATVGVLSYIFPTTGTPWEYAIAQVLGGGLILGAVFMATDYSSSPITKRGRMLYAIGCGFITFIIRRFSGYAEGVSFAILIMNSFTWMLDKKTMPRRFGKGGAFYGKREDEAE